MEQMMTDRPAMREDAVSKFLEQQTVSPYKLPSNGRDSRAELAPSQQGSWHQKRPAKK
jgi:hypothetical protein